MEKVKVPLEYSSSHNCHTLPVMSSTPKGLLPPGNASTGVVCPVALLHKVLSKTWPQGHNLPSVPWAEYCHSISEGSLLPFHRAYALASSRETQTTG